MTGPVRDTTEATLVRSAPGPGGYRRLQYGQAEQHRTRTDLLSEAAEVSDPARKYRHVGELLHLTDFQVADLASPSRVEYLQQLVGQPDWSRMLPAVRPQEFLLDHAIETMVRTVRRAVADGTASPDVVVSTGDNTDSAQLNEVRHYLRLMDGGAIRHDSDGGDFACTPTGSGDPQYWTPDPAVSDTWTVERGFPKDASVIDHATTPFTAVGIGLPWLTSFGNHDCLVQGRTAPPTDYDSFLTADRKPVELIPGDQPSGDALNGYLHDAYRWSRGPSARLTPRQERRLVDRVQWMREHFGTGGSPDGHGFSDVNLDDGTSWYCYDEIPGVRLISLDTTNPAGGVNGCVSEAQLRWLVDRLVEVHDEYLAADGSLVRTGHQDRLVVLMSHHGLSTLNNDNGAGTWSPRLYLAGDVEPLLHRFRNVVLWLSGHTHVNKVTARPRPGGGFWEISTSSLAEWPVQIRSVVLSMAPGLVRIRSTMLDSDAPARPCGTGELADLAALHREVAGNDDGSVGGLDAEGDPDDRNVDLLVPLDPRTAEAMVSPRPLEGRASP